MSINATKPVYTLKLGRSVVRVRSLGCHSDWRVGLRDVLYEDPSNPKRATHPCGPNFGALTTDRDVKENEQYIQNGKVHNLPKHGFLRTKQWSEVQYSQSSTPSLTLRLANTQETPDDRLLQQYPFHFEYLAYYELIDETTLFHRLSFRNLSRVTAVVDLASHNYHPWQNGLRVEGLGRMVYEDMTEWGNPMPATLCGSDFLKNKKREWHFYNEFGDSFAIEYPDGSMISLLIDQKHITDVAVQRMVIWTDPSEGSFICLEPVACGENSLNNGSAIQVASGATVSLGFHLHLSE